MTLEISSPSASAPLTPTATSSHSPGGAGSKWSPWVKKPLWAATDPHLVASVDGEAGAQKHLARHLTLFDLICIGVGATIGSGVFVLCGLVAHSYVGPATFLSWGIAGLAATLSGLCYAGIGWSLPSRWVVLCIQFHRFGGITGGSGRIVHDSGVCFLC